MLMIRGNPTVKYLLSAALAVVLIGAFKVSAASLSPTMTQCEFIQWMVQLSGDASSIPANATAADYVTWAQNQGIIPAGGWKPGTVLTRDVLAQVLVQFFNFKAKAGQDALKTLQREGILLPGNSSSSELSRKDIFEMFDKDSFQPRCIKPNKDKLTKHKTPTKGNTPPKKETQPRHDNGRSPWTTTTPPGQIGNDHSNKNK